MDERCIGKRQCSFTADCRRDIERSRERYVLVDGCRKRRSRRKDKCYVPIKRQLCVIIGCAVRKRNFGIGIENDRIGAESRR